MNCPVCNYDEVYFSTELYSYTCGSHDCYRILLAQQAKAIQIRCENPGCKAPFTASSRVDECGNHVKFACDECNHLLHGPSERYSYCRDCKQDERGCQCHEKIEYLYGGPLVKCLTCMKQTVWLDSQSGTGFAGGQIHLDTFSCGHNIMDESDDMAAAY